MHTTTVAEKLLARAEDYEKRAAALRIAAEELNGQLLGSKQLAMAATVASAIKVRKQQSPNGNGNGYGRDAFDGGGTPEERKARVQAMVIHFLKDGPRRSEDVRAYLKSQGYARGLPRVVQVLRETPSLELIGRSQNSRWQVAEEPRSQPERHEVPEKLTPYAATKARRADKREQILAILREHGKPMRVHDLAAAAKERGIDSLTGLYGMVLQGALAARGQGVKRTYRLAQ